MKMIYEDAAGEALFFVHTVGEQSVTTHLQQQQLEI